jgi:hypothetical protein
LELGSATFALLFILSPHSVDCVNILASSPMYIPFLSSFSRESILMALFSWVGHFVKDSDDLGKKPIDFSLDQK